MYGVLFQYLGWSSRSHGVDLLDRVLKRVVSLVGSGLSSDLPSLSHRRDVASLTMGNVPLRWRISYLLNVSLLESIAFLSRCIVIQLILLYAGLSFINQAFFLAQQPFGTSSLMNAFHQITISQHSKGCLTSSCCWSDL